MIYSKNYKIFKYIKEYYESVIHNKSKKYK